MSLVILLAFAKFVNWKISVFLLPPYFSHASILVARDSVPYRVHNFKHVWSYQGVSWFQGSAKHPAWLARRAGRVSAGTWRNAGVLSAVSAGSGKLHTRQSKPQIPSVLAIKCRIQAFPSGFSIQLPGSASGLPSIHHKTECADDSGN